MTNEQVELIVRIVLEIGKAHWVKHGTPIRPEDASFVAGDVLGRLPAEPKAPLTYEKFWQRVRETGWNPSPEDMRQMLLDAERFSNTENRTGES